jgi:hypothetical protein
MDEWWLMGASANAPRTRKQEAEMYPLNSLGQSGKLRHV